MARFSKAKSVLTFLVAACGLVAMATKGSLSFAQGQPASTVAEMIAEQQELWCSRSQTAQQMLPILENVLELRALEIAMQGLRRADVSQEIGLIDQLRQSREEYTLEAFQGELVKVGEQVSEKLGIPLLSNGMSSADASASQIGGFMGFLLSEEDSVSFNLFSFASDIEEPYLARKWALEAPELYLQVLTQIKLGADSYLGADIRGFTWGQFVRGLLLTPSWSPLAQADTVVPWISDDKTVGDMGARLEQYAMLSQLKVDQIRYVTPEDYLLQVKIFEPSKDDRGAVIQNDDGEVVEGAFVPKWMSAPELLQYKIHTYCRPLVKFH